MVNDDWANLLTFNGKVCFFFGKENLVGQIKLIINYQAAIGTTEKNQIGSVDDTTLRWAYANF